MKKGACDTRLTVLVNATKNKIIKAGRNNYLWMHGNCFFSPMILITFCCSKLKLITNIIYLFVLLNSSLSIYIEKCIFRYIFTLFLGPMSICVNYGRGLVNGCTCPLYMTVYKLKQYGNCSCHLTQIPLFQV